MSQLTAMAVRYPHFHARVASGTPRESQRFLIYCISSPFWGLSPKAECSAGQAFARCPHRAHVRFWNLPGQIATRSST